MSARFITDYTICHIVLLYKHLPFVGADVFSVVFSYAIIVINAVYKR